MIQNFASTDPTNTPLIWSGGATNFSMGNGAANIVFCSPFQCNDADELSLLVVPTFVGVNNFKIRVQWSRNSSAGIAANFAFDTFVTTAPAGTVNVITPFINEWLIPTTSVSQIIAIPVVGQMVRFGVFCVAAPNAGDNCSIDLFLNNGPATQN